MSGARPDGPTMTAEEVAQWEANVQSGNIHGGERFQHNASAYTHHRCRCELCHAAANAYQRQNYARNRRTILAQRRALREADKSWK